MSFLLVDFIRQTEEGHIILPLVFNLSVKGITESIVKIAVKLLVVFSLLVLISIPMWHSRQLKLMVMSQCRVLGL